MGADGSSAAGVLGVGPCARAVIGMTAAPAAPAMKLRRSNPDVGLESDMRRPPPRLSGTAHACAFAEFNKPRQSMFLTARQELCDVRRIEKGTSTGGFN